MTVVTHYGWKNDSNATNMNFKGSVFNGTRPSFDGTKHHVPRRAFEIFENLTTGYRRSEADPYAEGVAGSGYTPPCFKIGHDKYTTVMDYNNAESWRAHSRRENLLNHVATDSLSFMNKLDDHTTLVRVNEGVSTAGGGLVGAGTFAATLPAHILAGPFAPLTIAIHALASFAVVPAVTGGAASVVSRGLRGFEVDNWHKHFRDFTHSYSENASIARQDRQSNAGLRRAVSDEYAHSHIKDVMNDVDIRIGELLSTYQRVQPGKTAKVYKDAGVPLAGEKALYSRLEEALFKKKNLKLSS